jgi:hypothetical protein
MNRRRYRNRGLSPQVFRGETLRMAPPSKAQNLGAPRRLFAGVECSVDSPVDCRLCR